VPTETALLRLQDLPECSKELEIFRNDEPFWQLR
jgi:hypothetical protein